MQTSGEMNENYYPKFYSSCLSRRAATCHLRMRLPDGMGIAFFKQLFWLLNLGCYQSRRLAYIVHYNTQHVKILFSTEDTLFFYHMNPFATINYVFM